MTNLEKYHKVLKNNLGVTEAEMNDEVLAYNRFHRWESVRHIEMVADLEDLFDVNFGTLDVVSFNTYSKGIEILEKLGIDMSK